MKYNFFLLFLSSLFLYIPGHIHSITICNEEVEIIYEHQTTKVKLYIDGMSCMRCVEKIERKVSDIDGVVKVSVSLEQKYAIVHFDPSKTSVKIIVEKIDNVGYEVNKFELL